MKYRWQEVQRWQGTSISMGLSQRCQDGSSQKVVPCDSSMEGQIRSQTLDTVL
jgi:hypothetical protein